MNIGNNTSEMRLKQTSKCAIAAGTLGIISMLTQFLVMYELMCPSALSNDLFIVYSNMENALLIIIVISAVLALLFGIITLIQIHRSTNLKGKRLAIIGIIGGIVFLLCLGFLLFYREFLVRYY
jgi:hypothetical protein